jgi:predicted NodU family carbamoyl transferase
VRRGQVALVARSDAARAVSLPDGRAWAQVVDAELDPGLHAALAARADAPLALVTDFHLRSQAIVRSEADAVEAFQRSALDALVVEDRVYARD